MASKPKQNTTLDNQWDCYLSASPDLVRSGDTMYVDNNTVASCLRRHARSNEGPHL